MKASASELPVTIHPYDQPLSRSCRASRPIALRRGGNVGRERREHSLQEHSKSRYPSENGRVRSLAHRPSFSCLSFSVQTRYPTYVGDVAEVCLQLCDHRIKQVRCIRTNHSSPLCLSLESNQRLRHRPFLRHGEVHEVPNGCAPRFALPFAR